MLDMDPVSLARLQFGTTALYHFLFVPLTLGLSLLLAIMESAYVMTGREIWRDTTKFWGKLFGINFAMGVATGITMEFQFGTNWAYYSHYVGDIFGAPLAIEGLMAFFLEVDFRRSVLFWLGSLAETRPSHGDVAGRDRLEPFGDVDTHSQWMDAESGRCRLQPRYHADGTYLVLGSDLQFGRPGKVRPHRRCWLCHRLDVRCGDLGLLSARWPLPGIRQAIDHRGVGIRYSVGPMRSRSR